MENTSQLLHADHETLEGAVVVTVRGELDTMTFAVLAEELTAACNNLEASDRLVVDLRGIEFLGTDGISCLIDTQRQRAAHGASCWIVADQRVVLRPLAALGLIDRFEIVDRVEHAVAATSTQPMTSQSAK